MSRIYTIGHSDRSLDELVRALDGHDVTLLVDVRRFPGSQAHPHFNEENLATELPEHGIGYRHEEALGGRRSLSREGSPNDAWETPGFQAYADHALTDAFQQALGRLEKDARSKTPAIMCAEAVPWRCHRRIIADWLVARGHDVVDIFDIERARPHEPPAFARAEGGTVRYPGDGGPE